MVEQLHIVGRVCNIINVCNFIELLGEEVEDLTKDLIKHVVELYTEPDCNAETDEDKSEQPQIKLNKALQALQKLHLYKEQ